MVRVGGIVLCGGKSRRMGQGKAWLPFAGELMLPRVVRLVSQAVQPVVVVAAPRQDVPPLPSEIIVVRDEQEGLGPLAGLAAGLSAFTANVDAAFLSSCDAPFLRSGFVLRLIDLLGSHDACVPKVDGLEHPLCAVYRLDVLEAVRQLLAENVLRLGLLLTRIATRLVGAEELTNVDPKFQSLRNLNTWEEYQQALRDAPVAAN